MSVPDYTRMTAVDDNREHHVTHDDVEHGHDSGAYVAVCGHLVLPVSITAPDGRPCPGCASLADPPREPRNPVTRWLRGL